MLNELIENLANADRALPAFYSRAAFLRADIVETDKQYQFRIDAPGITRENIDVQLDNSILSVSAEVEDAKEEKDEKNRYHLNERYSGKFTRRFRVPKAVGKKDIDAKLTDGVLTVLVNKPDTEKKRIESKIKVS